MRTNLHEIPSGPALVGRSVPLEMLRTWLHGDTPSCGLIGAAGVGKTALLRAFAAECLEQDAAACDELWWVDVGGVSTIGTLVARIAHAAGITLPDSEDPRVVGAEIVRAFKGRGKVVLLLDGAHRIVLHERDPLPAGAFDGKTLKWVLTARLSTGVAQSRIFVPPLPPDAAHELLIRSARQSGVDTDKLPREGVAALAEQLDRMPLALELAGRWLLTMSPGQLAAALDRYPQFVAVETEVGGVRVAVEETWRRAAPEEREAVLAMAAADVDVTVEMAAALWSVELPAAARRLERLQWLSVIFPSRVGAQHRFSMFGSVRRAILDRMPAADAHSACRRLVAWIVAENEQWSLARRRAETAVIEWAFDWAVEHDAGFAGRLALANMVLAEHGEAFGPTLDQLYAALQRTVDQGSADAETSVDAARLYLAIARAHLLARDAAGAFEALDRAGAVADASGQKPIAARVACVRGRANLLAGELDAAVRESQRALTLIDGPDAVAMRALAHGTLAQVAMERLDLTGARQHVNAMEREAEWKGTATDAAIVNSIAWRVATATGAIEEVRTEVPTDVSGRIIAEYWFNAGEALLLLGRFDEAASAFRQILSASGLDHDTRAVLLRGAGGAVVATTSWAAPVESQPLALMTRYHEVLEWHYPETRARFYWGTLLALSGDLEAGWRQLRTALAISQRLGFHLHIRLFRGVSAIVARRVGRWREFESLGIPLTPSPHGEPPTAGASSAMAEAFIAGRAAAVQGATRSTPWLDLVAARLSGEGIATQTAPDKSTARGPALEIGPDWRWVRVAGGDESSLLRRHAGRGILQCLVRNHAERPGQMVDRRTLIDAGWPGERMLPESALARFHTTMWRLRQMGLAGLLTCDGDGYALEAGTVVTFVDA